MKQQRWLVRPLVWIALFVLVTAAVIGVSFLDATHRPATIASNGFVSSELTALVHGDPGKAEAVDRIAEIAYVGNDSCTRCHPEIARSYSDSGMSRSWQQVDSVPHAWPDADQWVTSPSDGLRYRIATISGCIEQEEFSDAVKGEPVPGVRKQAAYVVGSGNKARALVFEDHGYLLQLPVGWFANGGWAMNPGYEIRNHRFGRRITANCVACHAGQVPATAGDPGGRFADEIVSGISCERCHGPGQLHVEHHEGRLAGRALGLDRTIVNPAHLKPDLALDVCLQCHLQGDVHVYPQDRHAGTFRPGLKLSDHRLDYLIHSDRKDEIGVASHGARLMQSPCFQGSRSTMTCVTCHDPHASVHAQGRESFNSRCFNCHNCGSTAVAEAVGLQSNCVGCHMPNQSTREGVHVVVTDHWVVRDPAESRSIGHSVVDRLAPDSDLRLDPFWPQADPTGAGLGEAYLRLHESYGPQRPSLHRGAKLLLEALQRTPEEAVLLQIAGAAQLSLGQTKSGIGLLEQAVKHRPDNAETRFRLGVAYERTGRRKEAIHQFERAIKASPDWLEPYPWLARAQIADGKYDHAFDILQRQLARLPEPSTYVNMALLELLRGQSTADAMELIEQALNLDPGFAEAQRLRSQLKPTILPAGQAEIPSP